MYNRKNRILLSLLLGPFSWLYTYKKEETKIWINFGLSIITFGAYYFLIAYPWSVIDAVFRKEKFYKENHYDLFDKSTIPQGAKLLIVLAAISHGLMIMAFISLAALWMAYFSLGQDPNAPEKDVVRIVFWFLVWTIVLVLVISKWFKKFKKDRLVQSLKTSMWIFLVIIFITSGIIGATNGQSNASNKCSEKTTLSNSISSVYPIATDGGSGTAFAIDAEGSLITAYHVIDDQANPRLNLLKGSIPLRVVRTAPHYDLALLKADVPLDDKTFLNMDYDYTVGDQTYAIGWPANTFDVGSASYSKGIVSRILLNDDLKLNQPDVQKELEIVQTDAAINPGNSGGPLLSDCGVIGVVSAISDTNELGDYGFVSEQGIGYAISSKTVRDALAL